MARIISASTPVPVFAPPLSARASFDVAFIQEPDLNVNQGSSLLAMIELGKTKGYELVATTWCNGIFVHTELFDRFHIEDNTAKKDAPLPPPSLPVEARNLIC